MIRSIKFLFIVVLFASISTVAYALVDDEGLILYFNFDSQKDGVVTDENGRAIVFRYKCSANFIQVFTARIVWGPRVTAPSFKSKSGKRHTVSARYRYALVS